MTSVATLVLSLPLTFTSTMCLAQDSDIDFKASNFFEKLSEKKIDPKDSRAFVKAATAVLEKEGLPYKAYLKETSRLWTVCLTSSPTDEVCKQSTVGFSTQHDSCGTFTTLAVFAQSDSQWVFSNGSTPFRVPFADYLLPVTVVLQKSEAMVRHWAIPEKFEAAYLSKDLRTLILKATLSASLLLEVQESGRVRFIPPLSDLSHFISLSDKAYQDVQGLDGRKYQIMLPKKCP